MKILLTLFLLICSACLYAQTLAGAWRGTLVSTQNQTVSMPATIALRLVGNQLTGTLMLQNNGVHEKYILAGTTQGQQAGGTVTYTVDNSVFEFGVLLQNGQLVIAIGLLSVPALQGTFVRADVSSGRSTTPDQTATTPARTQPQATGVAGQWEQAFRGRRLIYISTKNGLSRKWYYDLCSNGEYAHRNLTNYLSGEFSQSFDDSEQGTWRVVMQGTIVYLECTPQNKASYLKTISPLTQGQVSLEGQRYFLDTNKSCQ